MFKFAPLVIGKGPIARPDPDGPSTSAAWSKFVWGPIWTRRDAMDRRYDAYCKEMIALGEATVRARGHAANTEHDTIEMDAV